MHPVGDEEYLAELERAYRSVSWGCVLFIVGLVGAAVALLILARWFVDLGDVLPFIRR